MNPNAYYEIPVNKYIFNLAEKPEEKVRQWAIYELLSNFGVNINSIEIEVPVRVGTRTHRADIVVYDNSVPYIVIECKRREDKSHKKSLDQAISYASSKELNAKYAVATNGSYWKCARKINDEWVNVSEIRNFRENDEVFISIVDVKRFLNDFKWIAKNLFETVPSNEVQSFFMSLHNFYICNMKVKGADIVFFQIAENLMRVIVNDIFLNDNYGINTLQYVLKKCSECQKQNHMNSDVSFIEMYSKMGLMTEIKSIILDVLKYGKLNFIEKSLSDMIISMSSYLIENNNPIRREEIILPYSARDAHIIQIHINDVLKEKFGMQLPEKNEDLDEFKIYFDIP